MFDEEFQVTVGVQKEAWNAFRKMTSRFLGNEKDPNVSIVKYLKKWKNLAVL